MPKPHCLTKLGFLFIKKTQRHKNVLLYLWKRTLSIKHLSCSNEADNLQYSIECYLWYFSQYCFIVPTVHTMYLSLSLLSLFAVFHNIICYTCLSAYPTCMENIREEQTNKIVFKSFERVFEFNSQSHYVSKAVCVQLPTHLKFPSCLFVSNDVYM